MHNAAAGMRAEILAGREIPHATVIAFSRGGPQRRRQRSRSLIDLSTDRRDLFRFLAPFCSVPYQSKIIRAYRYRSTSYCQLPEARARYRNDLSPYETLCFVLFSILNI